MRPRETDITTLETGQGERRGRGGLSSQRIVQPDGALVRVGEGKAGQYGPKNSHEGFEEGDGRGSVFVRRGEGSGVFIAVNSGGGRGGVGGDEVKKDDEEVDEDHGAVVHFAAWLLSFLFGLVLSVTLLMVRKSE